MRRDLDVGGTLREVFATYGAHAGVLLPLAFWIFLGVAVVDGLIGSRVSLLWIEIIVSTVAATLYQGMVVGLVRDVQDGRRESSARELLEVATPVLLPLIGAGLLSGLGIGIGLFALIVPGLILLTIWAVIAPVIVVERSGALAAFGRSRALVRGNGWPVFWVVLAAFLISSAGALIFGGIAAGISDGPVVRIVFGALAATITAPITALTAGILYFRLVAIERGAGASGPAPA
jgi:hypothetical protein